MPSDPLGDRSAVFPEDGPERMLVEKVVFDSANAVAIEEKNPLVVKKRADGILFLDQEALGLAEEFVPPGDIDLPRRCRDELVVLLIAPARPVVAAAGDEHV